MRQKIAITLASALAFIVIAAVLIPLPFKPSLWGFPKEKQLQTQLDKSSAAVYIETNSKDSFETTFTIYDNWVDAYQVGGYYQLSAQSKIGFDSEGPSKEDLQFLQSVIDGKQCIKSEQLVSSCSLPSTDKANQREFAVVWRDGTALITELTTMHHPNGTVNGRDNYVRKKQEDIDKILTTMAEVTPVELATAKANYFKPVY